MKDAIYDKGEKGDIVVLDNVALSESELSSYAQPAFFTIVEVKCGSDVVYVLKDMFGKEFTAGIDDGWWLVELTAWVKNKEKYHTDMLDREHLKVERLSHQIEILKDILINQGIRIVSEKQLKDLGIKKDIKL